MLAAVSRDESVLTGGIGPGQRTGRGTVVVEPLARLTFSGKWDGLPCGPGHPKNCPTFAREYLNKPHLYTVVSADGQGAMVHAAPTKLDECNGFRGTGTYSGAVIANSAIAASSTDFFADGPPPQLLDDQGARPVRRALAALVPRRLDSIKNLRVFALRLEGQDMVVVQRTFGQLEPTTENFPLKLTFAVGMMSEGHFRTLHWKQNTDEDERVLGTIHLKSGRDFLITTVSDPESHSFRVYGIVSSRLVLIYSGGGSSC